jgi:tetratricopeptide (TPR) repeat protein
MATLIIEFKQNPEKFPVQRLQKIIAIDERLTGMVYSLIYEDVVNKPAKYQLDLIDFFEPGSSVAPEYFNMARCHVLYHTGNKAEAFRLIGKIDVEAMPFCFHSHIRNRILKIKIYTEFGEKDKAIHLLENLFNYEDFKYLNLPEYYWAVLNLSKLYAESGQPHKARETIFQKKDYQSIRFIINIYGAFYYEMRGIIFMAEEKKSNAIRMFKKSLGYRENNEVRRKLTMLETRLS